MADDDELPGVKPAEASYSRGFVRQERSYVPGKEEVRAAQPTGVFIATCLACRGHWRVPDGECGVVHPDYNRMGERCSLAGTWVQRNWFLVW